MRSFNQGAEDCPSWEGRLQSEGPVSWGQSREMPSSCTDAHPEGRLYTTTALRLEQRGAGGSCQGRRACSPQGSAGNQAGR